MKKRARGRWSVDSVALALAGRLPPRLNTAWRWTALVTSPASFVRDDAMRAQLVSRPRSRVAFREAAHVRAWTETVLAALDVAPAGASDTWTAAPRGLRGLVASREEGRRRVDPFFALVVWRASASMLGRLAQVRSTLRPSASVGVADLHVGSLSWGVLHGAAPMVEARWRHADLGPLCE